MRNLITATWLLLAMTLCAAQTQQQNMKLLTVLNMITTKANDCFQNKKTPMADIITAIIQVSGNNMNVTKLRCFPTCVLEKLGIMTDKHTFSADAMKSNADTIPHQKMKELLVEQMPVCFANATSEDSCEKGLQLVDCYNRAGLLKMLNIPPKIQVMVGMMAAKRATQMITSLPSPVAAGNGSETPPAPLAGLAAFMQKVATPVLPVPAPGMVPPPMPSIVAGMVPQIPAGMTFPGMTPNNASGNTTMPIPMPFNIPAMPITMPPMNFSGNVSANMASIIAAMGASNASAGMASVIAAMAPTIPAGVGASNASAGVASVLAAMGTSNASAGVASAIAAMAPTMISGGGAPNI